MLDELVGQDPLDEFGPQVKSVALDVKSLASYDVVVISTNHAKVEYDLVAKHAKLIIDTRNAMKSVSDRANVLKA
jgi:UDP-N-acetyl-D-glucosamine dehydrogenase